MAHTKIQATCRCGKKIFVRKDHWESGRQASCGCSRKGLQPHLTHGHAVKGNESPTYISWKHMKERCLNRNHIHFRNYGGRGIQICKRWLYSFENFLADMGERPEGKTLDRYPNKNGNYASGNCRWATRKEQRANQRKAA